MINSGRGSLIIALLIAIIIIGASFLVGGLPTLPLSKTGSVLTSQITCCDSGDGESCKPSSEVEKTLTFNGQKYGLIKSKTKFIEGNLHLKDSGEKYKGQPIIVNSSEKHGLKAGFEFLNTACNRPDGVGTPKDLFFKKAPSDPYLFMRSAQPASLIAQYCDSVPDDEIIFVCRENCNSSACSFPVQPDANISCYGNENTIYDVYYRVADLATSGVPGFVKSCNKTPVKTGGVTIVPMSNQPQRENLQLQTFGFSAESINPGFSPFCKPAIYLYPQKQELISVRVNPVGKFTYTDPLYPENGWRVIANPDGQITSGLKTYPYLYYEADIPSILIAKPETGYSVKYEEVGSFLEDLLPKLGLNAKESQEMADYWKTALPKSPYYFIGQIPVQTLDAIAPLNIYPKPDTTLRVSLYFELLTQPEIVNKPLLENVKRVGFSVVEWGGVLKTDKPFTCLQ